MVTQAILPEGPVTAPESIRYAAGLPSKVPIFEETGGLAVDPECGCGSLRLYDQAYYQGHVLCLSGIGWADLRDLPRGPGERIAGERQRFWAGAVRSFLGTFQAVSFTWREGEFGRAAYAKAERQMVADPEVQGAYIVGLANPEAD